MTATIESIKSNKDSKENLERYATKTSAELFKIIDELGNRGDNSSKAVHESNKIESEAGLCLVRRAISGEESATKLLGFTQVHIWAATGNIKNLQDFFASNRDSSIITQATELGLGRTPLLLAVEYRQEGVLNYFRQQLNVSVNSKINCQGGGYFYVAHQTAMKGSLEELQFLKKLGCDFNRQADNNKFPLDEAVEAAPHAYNPNAVKFLIDELTPAIRTTRLNYALMPAVLTFNISALEILIQAGADINQPILHCPLTMVLEMRIPSLEQIINFTNRVIELGFALGGYGRSILTNIINTWDRLPNAKEKLAFLIAKLIEADISLNPIYQSPSQVDPLLIACSKNNIEAICLLIKGGAKLGNIQLPESSVKKILSNLEEDAKKGQADAQCALGNCYYNGNLIPRNLKGAVEQYQKAAAQGYARAQYNLGICYRNGTGTQKDVKQATELFQAALKQRYINAAKQLEELAAASNANNASVASIDRPVLISNPISFPIAEHRHTVLYRY